MSRATFWRTCCALALLTSLSGCLFSHGENLPRASAALEESRRLPPQPASFAYCRDHGCSTQRRIGLTSSEWQAVTAPLRDPAASAEEERARIAQAVGRFELAVGAKAGTHGDVGGTLTGFFRAGQQDCIDEAVNTTRFLLMLRSAGLLRHHAVGTPVHRAWIPGEFTHITATVTELTGAGGRYAIDSWFHGNGHPAEVAELSAWLDGWEPADWRFEATSIGAAPTALAVQ